MTSARGLYPLKFVECIRRYGFGGRRIPEYFGKLLPDGIIAETWEIADHGADVSTVRNGQLVGRTLRELILVDGSALLGTRVAASSPDRFPLLLKFLDAQRTLTMQVHPDDAYAAVNEPGETGKTEAWYIVHAAPGATLYCGSAPGLTRLALEQAILEGHPERCMVEIPVAAGDVVYVPAGRMHAIGQGILLFEAQQSCDLTYVPYPRPTDDPETGRRRVEKFLEATHFEGLGEQRIPSVGLSRGSSERRLLLANRYFAMDLLRLGDAWHLHLDGTRFLACSVLAGAGRVEFDGQPDGFRA